MKETIYKCDLCGATVAPERIADIKIKRMPSGGWKFDSVTKPLDLCEDCEATILEKMHELEQIKERV